MANLKIRYTGPAFHDFCKVADPKGRAEASPVVKWCPAPRLLKRTLIPNRHVSERRELEQMAQQMRWNLLYSTDLLIVNVSTELLEYYTRWLEYDAAADIDKS